MCQRFVLAVSLIVLGVVAACGGEAPLSLTVSVRTDHQPLRDFSAIEVTTAEAGNNDNDASQNFVARLNGQYVRPGVTLITFEDLVTWVEKTAHL